jgi:hypothetical protein
VHGGSEFVVIAGAGLMIKINGLLAVAPLASITWMVKLKLPAVVGAPLICPVPEFSVMPAGKAPVIVQVYGDVPPLTTGVTEHLTPTVHGCKGGKGPMIAGGGLIVKENSLLAGAPLTSVTWMVKLEVPAVVGVPLIRPVAEFRVMLAGNVPAASVQVRGNVPPLTTTACEYLTPTVPCGNGELVVITGGGFTVRLNCAEAVSP